MHLFSSRNVAATATSVVLLGWVLWFELNPFSLGVTPFVILTLLTVPLIGWWIRDEIRKHRHESQMQEFAEQFGWSYQSAGAEWSHRLHRYPFGQGTHRRDTAILRGQFAGLDCATFVHEFETRDRDSRSPSQQFQVTVVKLPFPLSSLDIVPEDGWAKVAKFLGGQDIDFESARFNAMWRVKASDAKYAHDVIHPRMMERLEGFDAAGLALRIEGEYVLAWQAGRQPVDTLGRRLTVLTSVARLIPEHVYREFAAMYEEGRRRAAAAEAAAPDWARTPGRLTDGKYNPDVLEATNLPPLPPIDTGARLSKGVGGYFPGGFFGLGSAWFDGIGGDGGSL